MYVCIYIYIYLYIYNVMGASVIHAEKPIFLLAYLRNLIEEH